MKKHIHKYERRKLGSWKKSGHDIYKCALPGCNHYIIDMEAVVGRYSNCWGEECPNQVEMTRYLVFSEKRKRPLCDDCKEKRKLERMSSEDRDKMEERMSAIDRAVAFIEQARNEDDEIYDE